MISRWTTQSLWDNWCLFKPIRTLRVHSLSQVSLKCSNKLSMSKLEKPKMSKNRSRLFLNNRTILNSGFRLSNCLSNSSRTWPQTARLMFTPYFWGNCWTIESLHQLSSWWKPEYFPLMSCYRLSCVTCKINIILVRATISIIWVKPPSSFCLS